MTYETFPDAQPLDPDEYAELNANENWKHLITEIDGKFYNADDLWHCEECEAPFPERALLDDLSHCELCAQDIAENDRHIRQESW